MRYLVKKRFSTMQVAGLLAGVVFSVATLGYAFDLTNTFNGRVGDVISGEEVQMSFNELGTGIDLNADDIITLNAALPIMAASTDTNPDAPGCTGCGMIEVNAVTMTGLSDGHLVISGNCFIDNDQGNIQRYQLLPVVESGIPPNTQPLPTPLLTGAIFQAAADSTLGVAAERFTLAYTVTVPVTAAANYTISQQVGPFGTGATADFKYNLNCLTVLFVPLSQGSTVILP